MNNFFECEQGLVKPIVRGKLKSNIDFGREIGAPEEIIRLIDFGYMIPFYTTPAPAVFNNNKSARDNSDSLPDIINPLSVFTQSPG